MNQTQVQEELPTGWRVPWSLMVLAAPIIASMCSRTVLSFVDFVMVSQLGPEAQAAIMPAGIVLFAIISFGMGILMAVNTFVSQALGRRDYQLCAVFAWQGFHISMLMGLIAVPMWFIIEPMFAWVNHAPAVQAMEVTYVKIGLLGMAPTLAGMGLANFFNGIHKPGVGLWAMIISNLFNIVGNYVLIFGHLGFPAMGIAGAAWATLAAAILQAIILLVWMLRPAFHNKFQTRTAWRLDTKRMARLLWYGLPAGVQHTADILAFTIFTLVLVGRFGTIQLAAHNLVFKLLEVSFMPTIGLGVALTAAVGKAIGHGRPDYARTLTRWTAGFSVAYMGTIGIGYVLFRYPLADLLSMHNPDVTAWAAKLLLLCAVFQIFDALNITHISALRGAGDNHWPAVASAVLSLLILVGGGYAIAIYYPSLGAVGPWMAATSFIVILGIIMHARWIWGPWERIDVFEEPNADPELVV